MSALPVTGRGGEHVNVLLWDELLRHPEALKLYHEKNYGQLVVLLLNLANIPILEFASIEEAKKYTLAHIPVRSSAQVIDTLRKKPSLCPGIVRP